MGNTSIIYKRLADNHEVPLFQTSRIHSRIQLHYPRRSQRTQASFPKYGELAVIGRFSGKEFHTP